MNETRKNKLIALATILLTVLLSAFVGVPLVEADTMSRSWGTMMNIQIFLQVGNSEEIESGYWAYITQAQGPGSKTVIKADWEAMISGDFSIIAAQIRQGIPGSEPTWISCSWDSVSYDAEFERYYVAGFTVVAMVKNINAGLTGLEIVIVLIAIALLATVITACLTGSWVTTKVIQATEAVGPWATILIGGVIIVGLGFLVYTLFGGKVNYRSKRRSLSTGKGEN